jgi:hypothetical protein
MRSPLNGIIGTLKLVKNESLSDNQKRYLEMTENPWMVRKPWIYYKIC